MWKKYENVLGKCKCSYPALLYFKVSNGRGVRNSKGGSGGGGGTSIRDMRVICE